MHVVSCERRPVPLIHQLYTGPDADLRDDTLQPLCTHTVLDQNGVFSDDR